MKRILVFVMILCFVFLLFAGAQNIGTGPGVDKMNDTGEKGTVTAPIPAPVPKPVTRLTVKLIDEMNDKMVELDNCIVQVAGELHICEDSFNYSNSFTDGGLYDITIWVKLKK